MSSTPKELECSLCKDIYREPKTLNCLHSFCLECLETLLERNHSNIQLACPLCRTHLHLEPQQLSTLPTDSFLLNSLKEYNGINVSENKLQQLQQLMCLDGENEATHYCLDCQEYLCSSCTKPHQKAKITANHQVISIDDAKNENVIMKQSSLIYCETHQQEEVKLYCDDCKLPICSVCTEQHHSHKMLTLSSIIGNEKQSLIDLINQVKPKEKELREGIHKCEEMIKQLEINSTTTQTQINQLFNKIRIKLDEKEQELINKLAEIEKYKKKGLELQKEELKFGIESIIGSCQMIENSLSLSNQNKNDVKLLSMKNLYNSRLNYLANNLWKAEPCQNPFIDLLVFHNEEKSLYSTINNIGAIDSNDILAEKCLISRNVMQRIGENEEFRFEVISYSKEGNKIERGGNNRFKVIIESESKDEKKSEWKITDLNNGRYEVVIQIADKGKYSIFVQYDGVNIFDSPFQLQILRKQRNYNGINQSKLTFGSTRNKDGQLSLCYGMTIDSKRNVLVCDYTNHQIQKFDSNGQFISTFCSKGNGNGQLQNPFGIILNSKGNIIVSDLKNHRIQIFDPQGKFILTFGSRGAENGQFNRPWGVSCDLNDNIYVCDFGNHRIQKFNSNGQFILSFGSEGKGNGQFKNPGGITINSKGNIIVSDDNNHRIQIFDSQGAFILTFGEKGIRDNQFNSPHGICIDLNDNIYVCDYGNNQVQIFDHNGNFIGKFEVISPIAITIDNVTQNIFVSGDDNKISIF